MYQRCGCENCGCHNGCGSCQEELLLGMVRIADHAFENAYEFERALARGTLFPELDKPFYGKVKGGCGCHDRQRTTTILESPKALDITGFSAL